MILRKKKKGYYILLGFRRIVLLYVGCLTPSEFKLVTLLGSAVMYVVQLHTQLSV